MKFEYPIGEMMMLTYNILLTRLPALRSLDLGMDYYGTYWSYTTTTAPLTYLRVSLADVSTLIRLMSTQPLSNTLRQLHIKIGDSHCKTHSAISMSNLSIQMVNLHTFTLVQTFFSRLTIEWADFEMLISSNVMPILRRANVSLFININDLNCISSSALFTDHRHVDVHFAFNFINCPQYIKVTPYIPHGNCFHPRDIIGATFTINHWCYDRSNWSLADDPFVSYFSYIGFASYIRIEYG